LRGWSGNLAASELLCIDSGQPLCRNLATPSAKELQNVIRTTAVCGLALLLVTGPALGQPASQPNRSSQVPVDHGPFTPEANGAFQGGGMILQGAPGEPAPRPEPTPPGQTPRNMVPPR
jgi:hypothetical protein